MKGPTSTSEPKAQKIDAQAPNQGDESNQRFKRLPREWFACDTVTQAKKLLGKVIRRNLKDGTILRARIVETEAYKAPEDKGCHAYNNKRTPKTEAF